MALLNAITSESTPLWNTSSLNDPLNQTARNPMWVFAAKSTSLASRNLLVGLLGMIFNLMGIVLLVVSRDVRSSIKIALLSLAFNDLGFVINTFANGLLTGVKTTNHLGCWPSSYCGFTSIIISYLSIVLLSVHNYVAVFYPLHTHGILTTGRTAFIVAMVWIVGCLVGLASTGIKFQPGKICVGLSPMPMYGVLLLTVTCSVCAWCVAVLNLKIFIKVRKASREIQHFDPSSTARSTSATNVRTAQQSHASCSDRSQGPSPDLLTTANFRPTMIGEPDSQLMASTDDGVKMATKSLTTSTPMNSSQARQDTRITARINSEEDSSSDAQNQEQNLLSALHSHPSTSQEELAFDHKSSSDNWTQDEIAYRLQFPRTHRRRKCPGSGKSSTGFSSKQEGERQSDVTPTELLIGQSREVGKPKENLRDGNKVGHGRSMSVFIVTAPLTRPSPVTSRKLKSGEKMVEESQESHDRLNKKRASSSSAAHLIVKQSQEIVHQERETVSSEGLSGKPRASVRTAPGGRNPQRQGHARIRNTLAIISLWCSFVTLPFLIYALVVTLGVQRDQFARSDGGIFLSSLVLINAITNPLLYAWRFVQWSLLRNKMGQFGTRLTGSCRGAFQR